MVVAARPRSMRCSAAWLRWACSRSRCRFAWARRFCAARAPRARSRAPPARRRLDARGRAAPLQLLGDGQRLRGLLPLAAPLLLARPVAVLDEAPPVAQPAEPRDDERDGAQPEPLLLLLPDLALPPFLPALQLPQARLLPGAVLLPRLRAALARLQPDGRGLLPDLQARVLVLALPRRAPRRREAPPQPRRAAPREQAAPAGLQDDARLLLAPAPRVPRPPRRHGVEGRRRRPGARGRSSGGVCADECRRTGLGVAGRGDGTGDGGGVAFFLTTFFFFFFGVLATGGGGLGARFFLAFFFFLRRGGGAGSGSGGGVGKPSVW